MADAVGQNIALNSDLFKCGSFSYLFYKEYLSDSCQQVHVQQYFNVLQWGNGNAMDAKFVAAA